jgi:SAM-dependent methyltransferase
MPFQSRFGKAALAYCTYRPGYSPELYEHILAALPAGARGRAMDLGAGTGQATRELAALFAEVIAVEPDPLMAEKLKEVEPRAIVRVTTAEECEQEPSSVDMVMAATALHWMDVPRAIENAERWLKPRGVLAICGGGLPRMPNAVWAVVKRDLLELWDAFRDPRLKRKDFPESIVRVAKELEIVEEASISQMIEMTAHDFAGFWRSTSYASAYGRTLGHDEEQYWRGLEERIHVAWPGEQIPIDFKIWLIVMRKEQEWRRELRA